MGFVANVSSLAPLVGLAVPIALAGRAAAPARSPLAGVAHVTAAALGLALLAVVLAAVATLAALAPPAAALAPAAARLVRLDVLAGVMLVLVTGLGTVVARFSRAYLAGDPGATRYARWLAATLAAVTALVVARDLLLVAAAWTATSLSLHQLLTFYGDRVGARLAAHKKFLVSRLADVCLITSLVLLHRAVGSLDLDAVDAWAAQRAELPAGVEASAALLVVAACLRSAQLPFHGWLTQVMEAPTPVSALLHAGVVNLGGFLLLRLAPVLALARVAPVLLVGVGLTTAVVASLVGTTRTSVKTSLAWSTCAQMGFMLVQCGLGLYHLALLHLVAHSLYKAHAFLGSGGVVRAFRRGVAGPARVACLRTHLVAGVAVGLGASTAAVALGGGAPTPSLTALASLVPTVVVLGTWLGLAIVQWAASAEDGRSAAFGAVVGALYLGGHELAAWAYAAPVPAPSAAAWTAAAAAFVALFTLHAALSARPAAAWAVRARRALAAGLYLDDLFTRFTFRVWPPRLPRPTSRVAVRLATPKEIRP